MIDDSEHATMTVDQRQAAERAMRKRDRQMGRSPMPGDLLLSPSPSPARSGDGTS